MIETPVEKPFKIFLAALISTFFFGVMNIFVKLAAETHSPIEIMFFRNLLSLPTVCCMMIYTGGWALFRPKSPLGLFLRSLSGTISMYFFFLSFALLPIANAVSISSCSPLFQTALSIPLLKEKVGKHRWAAVIVGFLAVLYMFKPTVSASLLGNFAAIAAAFFSAFAMLAIRKVGQKEHPLTIVFFFALFATCVTAAFLPFTWHTPTLQSLFYLLMTGILGSIAQMFMTYTYVNANVSYVSTLGYLGIVFGAFSDWLVWGKIIESHIAIGSVVIIASGLYILHREIVKKKVTPPPCSD